jgi:hypothetical protein
MQGFNPKNGSKASQLLLKTLPIPTIGGKSERAQPNGNKSQVAYSKQKIIKSLKLRGIARFF